MASEIFKIIGVLAVGIVAVIGFAMKPEMPFPDENDLKEMLPGAARFSILKHDPVEHWLGFDENNRTVGAIFLTDRVPPEVQGYGGTVRILAGVRANGALTSEKILCHTETPAYFARLREQEFLSHFEEIRLDNAASWQKIDAVTGATVSSDAVRDDLLLSGRTVAGQVFGLPFPAPPAKAFPWLQVFGLLGVFGLSFLASYRRERFWHGVSLAGGFLVIGVWLNASFSLQPVAGLLQGRFPTLETPIPMLMLLFVLITGLTRGRQYCHTLCPYGAVQETLSGVSALKIVARPKMARWLSNLPFLLLFLSLLLYLANLFPEALGLEPFQHLFAPSVTDFATLGFALGVLGLSLVSPRFWCRFFCPSGAAMALWARLRFWRKSRRPEAEDIDSGRRDG